MDEKQTRDFIKRANGYAKRHRLSQRSLSKRLFNKNPYGLERLEEALKEGAGGPAHVNVLQARKKLADLEDDENSRAVMVNR